MKRFAEHPRLLPRWCVDDGVVPRLEQRRQCQKVGQLGAKRDQDVVSAHVIALRGDDQVPERWVAVTVARFHQRQIERKTLLEDLSQTIGPSFRIDQGVDGPLLLFDVPTEITGSMVDRWSLALDQAVESANMHVYSVFQHLTPEVDLVTRDPAVSHHGKLAHVNAPLDDFDLLYTGARIYF